MTTTKRAFYNVIASAALLLGAAQAHALNFDFKQKFDLDGFSGTVDGAFSAVDTNSDGFFQASEMTILSLTWYGTTPVGFLALAFSPPNVSIVGTTEWFANGSDKTLGDAGNGFYLAGTSTTGTQMVWSAGPGNFFDYGNTPGLNSGGDPQNSTFRFGQIDLFDSANVPLATAKSDEYATIIPSAVPEPATYLMMLGGIAALVLRAQKHAK